MEPSGVPKVSMLGVEIADNPQWSVTAEFAVGKPDPNLGISPSCRLLSSVHLLNTRGTGVKLPNHLSTRLGRAENSDTQVPRRTCDMIQTKCTSEFPAKGYIACGGLRAQ